MTLPHSSTFPHHVAAGCLHVSRVDSGLSDEQWYQLPEQWNPFFRSDQELNRSIDASGVHHIELAETLHKCPHFPPELQELLLKLALAPFAKLFRHHWIELEFTRSQDDADVNALIRVYLLPDDKDRSLINRSNKTLRRHWNSLLSKLDFSASAWKGKSNGDRSFQPALMQPPDKDGAESSLLQLFNTIPSPKPNPEYLLDSNDRDYCRSLLNCDIPGLKTQLFLYQREAAASMFQRETQPLQCIDPRLCYVVDQHEDPWFFDCITGEVLKDGRSYEGVSGGILAEEMGSGKTLICLALIAATRQQPAYRPEIYTAPAIIRPKLGSLADMAAAAGSMASVPWRSYFSREQCGDQEYTNCLGKIDQNPGWYLMPRPAPKRVSRQPAAPEQSDKLYLSCASLVIVPTNLLEQWKDEITKHTPYLRTLVLTKARVPTPIPNALSLLQYDIILVSMSRFERLIENRIKDRHGSWVLLSPLGQVHFKRIIIDEGHALGHSTLAKKSNLLLVVEHLQTSARWVVTGTPSKGLYGVDGSCTGRNELSDDQERKDTEHIGSIATHYLNARPWANKVLEDGDTTADWRIYVMQTKNNNEVQNHRRHSILKSTLNSLIIRHPKSELSRLLPKITERTVYIDGSYQDIMSLNLFAAHIILNSVQSQRVDQDYFFHPKQRKYLDELVSNERQASFFGGNFFTASDIQKAVLTAEEFLQKGDVVISKEDDCLIREAIAFGKTAEANKIREVSSRCFEVPIYVEEFPGKEYTGVLSSWAVDGKEGDRMCTISPLVVVLQRYVRPWLSSPESLEIVFNSGKFASYGAKARNKAMGGVPEIIQCGEAPSSIAFTEKDDKVYKDVSKQKKARSGTLEWADVNDTFEKDEEIAEPLAKFSLVSTASAKLSYLIDQITKYKDAEKILVFYETENVGWSIAGCLEILHIPHLIYAKNLKAERRAQYVATFNETSKFRVMLMDLKQAAFGLNMNSASRIYFVNPVLNPQVEAQAIGRARRIGQSKDVTVETLVLRGTLEELVVERKKKMTQEEHRRIKSIMDDKPFYEWFQNARILPLPDVAADDGPGQMAPLAVPVPLFGRGSGQIIHPDQDLLAKGERHSSDRECAVPCSDTGGIGSSFGRKRPLSMVTDAAADDAADREPKKPAKGVRFA
ncbi:hypothetical protein MCOR02_005610 [Pyricularia oryzae]|uniref:Helicase C-terminal domain-containing protein n=1 Tax=Pyricularia oryzae TaxID=318829 RepID=A0A4P7NLG2_PYROR|nr:hypothetical protein MCOR02_005610 [Pyricularia oryzae]KAI6289748.1 hypothetical protein MCOR34_010651 [Pyricularia oryzae]KAI6503157.1 hypothetical protein MCOR13_005175 [Pyricularia oryzae]KAI6644950.1 hypothetical protein MCOR14_000661 [Pyricularia oryzae]QBZ62993.1 hypothetical protein PoMZ_11883 [Pyricularia oryzae]